VSQWFGEMSDAAKWLPTVANSSKRLIQQENSMPQSPHDRVAELHNLAGHAHAAAATAHGKGDHLTAHELSKQAHEHSINAYKHAKELITVATESNKPLGADLAADCRRLVDWGLNARRIAAKVRTIDSAVTLSWDNSAPN
jgi:hypothetical protein